MFSGEMMKLLFSLLKTWQVIAVTVAIVLYIFLINYVARTYHRPRFVSKSKPKKAKPPAAEKPGKADKKKTSEKESNEELGLEEA